MSGQESYLMIILLGEISIRESWDQKMIMQILSGEHHCMDGLRPLLHWNQQVNIDKPIYNISSSTTITSTTTIIMGPAGQYWQPLYVTSHHSPPPQPPRPPPSSWFRPILQGRKIYGGQYWQPIYLSFWCVSKGISLECHNHHNHHGNFVQFCREGRSMEGSSWMSWLSGHSQDVPWALRSPPSSSWSRSSSFSISSSSLPPLSS